MYHTVLSRLYSNEDENSIHNPIGIGLVRPHPVFFLGSGERFFARFQAHEGELMRSPKVGNQGGETTFSSAFVDRTVQHSAWPIVRVDLPQVVCLGVAPRKCHNRGVRPSFDQCRHRELNPGRGRARYLSEF